MPRAKNDVSRINLYVQNNVLRAYKALAHNRQVTFSELVRAAMRQYIKQEIEKERADGNT